MSIKNTQYIEIIEENAMNIKKNQKAVVPMQKPVKKFATDKEVAMAADFAMTKYAEAIKRLADR